MSQSKMFILGTLNRNGPMHGHQMRRAAQVDRTEMWSEVKPGALYQALHRMEQEGTIEAVRVEQAGNRPARTVYQITDEGQTELTTLRNAALRTFLLRPDAADLAVQNLAGMGEDQLKDVLTDRRNAISNERDAWAHVRQTAQPHLRAAEDAIIEHSLLRLDAELQWHDYLLGRLGEFFAPD